MAFPYSSFPSGWFQIGWSGEYEAGDIRPLRYFGQDLVCYRGESSRLVVLDAHCPHLGAHLGYQYDDEVIDDAGRRRIEGDNIRCPWHGWCWSANGENVDIPYSTHRHRGKGPRSWNVREQNGQIFLWHDALAREPSWEPPVLSECSDDGYYPIYPWSIREWKNLTMQPQNVIENGADFEHLRYVHRHTGAIEVLDIGTDGHKFWSDIATTFETPKGELRGRIRPQGWGVGITAVQLSGIHDITHIMCVTPVDHTYSDAFAAVAVRRIPGEPEPNKFAHALVSAEHHQVERDILMWANAKWIERPPFAPEESSGFRLLRKWARQFYPDAPADQPEDDLTPAAI